VRVSQLWGANVLNYARSFTCTDGLRALRDEILEEEEIGDLCWHASSSGSESEDDRVVSEVS
jgi:hypothetical protein